MTPAAPVEEDKQESKQVAKKSTIADGEKNTPKFSNAPLIGKRLHKDAMPATTVSQPLKDNESADLENNLAGVLTDEFLERIEAAKQRIEDHKQGIRVHKQGIQKEKAWFKANLKNIITVF